MKRNRKKDPNLDRDYGNSSSSLPSWYHGSPLKLTTLAKGSTITQDSDLARVFSHKPTLVSVSDDGTIEHNGTTPGFLYRITEDIQPDDIRPHPHSVTGKEWLTNRQLPLMLLGPTQIIEKERLSEKQIIELKQRLSPRDA